MVKRWGLPALAILLVLVALWVWFGPGSAPAPRAAASPAPAAAINRRAAAVRPAGVPAIGLDRAKALRDPAGAGKRNVFEYYQPPAPVVAQLPDAQSLTPAVPTPTPLPPLNLKYVGSAERSGVRKAIFMTDHNEVLTGGVGETVANRVKVVRINLESIDVQDLLSGLPRRIPLKGN